MKRVFFIVLLTFVIFLSDSFANEKEFINPKGEDRGSETEEVKETKVIEVPKEVIDKQQRYLKEWEEKLKKDWSGLSDEEKEEKRRELKEKILGE